LALSPLAVTALPEDEPSPVLALAFALSKALSYSVIKNEMEKRRPPPRKERTAMWTRATPIKNPVRVVSKRHMMTLRMNGMRRIPPPGWRICAANDDIFGLVLVRVVVIL